MTANPKARRTTPLMRAHLAATSFDKARDELHDAIRAARADHTLREIAAATGLSPEWVRQIASANGQNR